jgi:hypothetical protein
LSNVNKKTKINSLNEEHGRIYIGNHFLKKKSAAKNDLERFRIDSPTDTRKEK